MPIVSPVDLVSGTKMCDHKKLGSQAWAFPGDGMVDGVHLALLPTASSLPSVVVVKPLSGPMQRPHLRICSPPHAANGSPRNDQLIKERQISEDTTALWKKKFHRIESATAHFVCGRATMVNKTDATRRGVPGSEVWRLEWPLLMLSFTAPLFSLRCKGPTATPRRDDATKRAAGPCGACDPSVARFVPLGARARRFWTCDRATLCRRARQLRPRLQLGSPTETTSLQVACRFARIGAAACRRASENKS